MNNKVNDFRTGMIGVLAFAGDLSMGQPPNHSPRTAILAARLAEEIRCSSEMRKDSSRLALLRWSGCTANADEFDQLFGDDIAGRAALIAGQNPFVNGSMPKLPLSPVINTLASIHCETGIEIVNRLQLGNTSLSIAFMDLFEQWDGNGNPSGKKGDAIETVSQIVSIAGDLEVWSRVHGLQKALLMLEETAGARHEPILVATVIKNAAIWMTSMDEVDCWTESAVEINDNTAFDADENKMAYLLADYVDLKIPSFYRLSRSTGHLVKQALSGEDAPELVRASLIYTLGLVSVPNKCLLGNKIINDSIDEATRIAPHWTERILSRCPALSSSASIAGSAFERLDGSGFYKGLKQHEQNAHSRLLQVAALATQLLAQGVNDDRSVDEVCQALVSNVSRGKIDAIATEKVISVLGVKGIKIPKLESSKVGISPREKEVLSLLSNGLSNKEISRNLNISTSTVGTHIENIYSKLEVSNRATATLRALEEGLLV